MPTIKPGDGPVTYEMKFHGGVNNSKGHVLWDFDIIVEFNIDRSLKTIYENDQEEVNNFINNSYKRAAVVFDAFLHGRPFIGAYVLCPSLNQSLGLSMFQ